MFVIVLGVIGKVLCHPGLDSLTLNFRVGLWT